MKSSTYDKLIDKADKLMLNECKQYMTEDEVKSLNEGSIAGALIPLGVIVAMYVALFAACAFSNRAQKKKDARNATAVDRKELREALDVMRDNFDKLKARMTGELKKYVDCEAVVFNKDIITRAKEATNYNSKSLLDKGEMFYANFGVGSVNFYKYAKETAKTNKFVTVDGAKSFVAAETEKFGKALSAGWDALANDNEILSKYFRICLEVEGTIGYIVIRSEALVLKDSKYLSK